MSRAEIGSYLGLTIETVSRVFSRLQQKGLIEANRKEVEIKDIDLLCETANIQP
jgi:CRP/FNR family transcriptional regulator